MSQPLPRRLSWAYALTVTLLAVSGTMQMPIASRYRITAVPGLAWLGDFWFTHKLHYLGAIALLTLVFYLGARWVLEWRRNHALTFFGLARAGILTLLILTGAMRVLKNLPGVSFSPRPIMLVDWAHLALAALLGLLALLRLSLRASSVRASALPGKAPPR
ncbi:MAG: 4Fe-4S ferredoxin [Proteobacteria bacterium]|nr:4Fe-4S ferredoxin [Pseudomonadota bacterium]MBU1595333.1 4Fe-4S ferredoxin [Pseudomonadota bacterium]